MDNFDNWVPVYGLPEFEINEFGIIRRIQDNSILPQHNSGKGYLFTNFKTNDGNVRYPTHLLVLESFNSPKPELKENEVLVCNHKDGIKYNNRQSNLEWVSNSDNIKHAYEKKLNAGSQHILIMDTQAGKEEKVYSLRALSIWLGNKNISGRGFMTKYGNGTLYKDRWTFKYVGDLGHCSGLEGRNHFYAFDAASFLSLRETNYDSIFIYCNSLHEGAGILGISRRVLGKILNKTRDNLANGYYICKNQDELAELKSNLNKDLVVKSIYTSTDKRRNKSL